VTGDEADEGVAPDEGGKMRKWYFPQLKKFEPLVDFEFVFTNDGSSYQKEWRVTKVTDGRVLAHSWIYKGYPGSSEVTFELSARSALCETSV